MTDETVDIPIQDLPTEPVVTEPIDIEPMPPPKPKQKGRPPGSKDAIKRTRKPPIQVRIEPLEPEPEPKPEPKPRERTPRPPRESHVMSTEHEIEEPTLSPRSMLRETSRHLITLRGLVHDTRKTTLATMYTQNLHRV
jgi:hypothetical protein